MPSHTSKNVHKAEHEFLDTKYREHWANTPRHCWYDDCLWDSDTYGLGYQECRCFRGETCELCRPRISTPVCACCHRDRIDCQYYCKDPSCDLCYEYITMKDRKELIEESFPPQQILETLQTHLRDTNCWCYNRIQNAITRDRIERHIRARRCSSDVIIPDVLTPNHIPPCIVKILDKQLGQEIHALHRQRDLNEKRELLAKYGRTLEEYATFRRERPDICGEPTERAETPVPKQKFVKVKESILQIGSF